MASQGTDAGIQTKASEYGRRRGSARETDSSDYRKRMKIAWRLDHEGKKFIPGRQSLDSQKERRRSQNDHILKMAKILRTVSENENENTTQPNQQTDSAESLLLENLNGDSGRGFLHSLGAGPKEETLRTLLQHCVYCQPPYCEDRQELLQRIMKTIQDVVY
ncbi:hypothetical protein RP20_CCG025242 [Aedes albopictus]|nr:hypothetical protein RP20_CCG025242 [Aedes albopictus]